MSIIVKGMRMPENCLECTETGLNVGISANNAVCPYCYKIVHDHNMKESRHPDCPLGVLPDKHGYLIDREEAYDCIAEQEGGNYVDMDTVGKGLECATIIVEAEGEK